MYISSKIKFAAFELFIATVVNTVLQLIIKDQHSHFDDKQQLKFMHDGLNYGILDTACINFFESFITAPQNPISYIVASTAGIALSSELGEITNVFFTGIATTPALYDHLSALALTTTRYALKYSLYYPLLFEAQEDHDILIKCIVPGLAGGIAYALTSPDTYSNELIWKTHFAQFIYYHSNDFWDGFRNSVAHHINSVLPLGDVPFIDKIIFYSIAAHIEMFDNYYKNQKDPQDQQDNMHDELEVI